MAPLLQANICHVQILYKPCCRWRHFCPQNQQYSVKMINREMAPLLQASYFEVGMKFTVRQMAPLLQTNICHVQTLCKPCRRWRHFYPQNQHYSVKMTNREMAPLLQASIFQVDRKMTVSQMAPLLQANICLVQAFCKPCSRDLGAPCLRTLRSGDPPV